MAFICTPLLRYSIGTWQKQLIGLHPARAVQVAFSGPLKLLWRPDNSDEIISFVLGGVSGKAKISIKFLFKTSNIDASIPIIRKDKRSGGSFKEHVHADRK
jgi:hypothetical protein